MLLSTSSNIHLTYMGKPCFSVFDSMRAVWEAGFSNIDITLAAFCGPQDEFAGPNWRRFIDRIGELSAKLSLPINQTHTLFYQHVDSEENLRFHEKMAERCIEATGILGAPWTVMHILRVIDLNTTDKALAMQKNAEYFAPYGDIARKAGTGVAIENGLTGFYHSADELLALLGLLKDDAFGLCWDTGHANITGQDQRASIEKMGARLKCLHINDNHAAKDEHLLPCFGTVDFAAVLSAVKALSDPPILTYESAGSTKNLPPSARLDALKMAVKIGEWLNSL